MGNPAKLGEVCVFNVLVSVPQFIAHFLPTLGRGSYRGKATLLVKGVVGGGANFGFGWGGLIKGAEYRFYDPVGRG